MLEEGRAVGMWPEKNEHGGLWDSRDESKHLIGASLKKRRAQRELFEQELWA
jgi:hypothetical protein